MTTRYGRDGINELITLEIKCRGCETTKRSQAKEARFASYLKRIGWKKVRTEGADRYFQTWYCKTCAGNLEEIRAKEIVHAYTVKAYTKRKGEKEEMHIGLFPTLCKANNFVESLQYKLQRNDEDGPGDGEEIVRITCTLAKGPRSKFNFTEK